MSPKSYSSQQANPSKRKWRLCVIEENAKSLLLRVRGTSSGSTWIEPTWLTQWASAIAWHGRPCSDAVVLA